MKNFKGFVLGFLACALLFSLAIPAIASNGNKQATLSYSDIKITLDGQSITPKDGAGNVVEPFIIDGTTYLPVRGIASALGLDVAWEQSTSTVKLSSKSNADNNVPKANTSEDAVKGKVDVRAIPTLDGTVCIFIKNNSDVIIDELDVQINYLDGSNQIIDLASDGHDMILPGYTVVSRMAAPTSYSTFKVDFSIKLGVNARYKNHSDNCEITASKGDDCVIVQVTNESSVLIDEIEYIVVLYQGDEIVYVCFPTDIRSVKAGETIIKKESTYAMTYDKIEVYLNQAHTFGI